MPPPNLLLLLRSVTACGGLLINQCRIFRCTNYRGEILIVYCCPFESYKMSHTAELERSRPTIYLLTKDIRHLPREDKYFSFGFYFCGIYIAS